MTDGRADDSGMQGTLDIMVQRTGDQGQGTIVFIQNNFYYDAFFLKAIGESQLWALTLSCLSPLRSPQWGVQ